MTFQVCVLLIYGIISHDEGMERIEVLCKTFVPYEYSVYFKIELGRRNFSVEN